MWLDKSRAFRSRKVYIPGWCRKASFLYAVLTSLEVADVDSSKLSYGLMSVGGSFMRLSVVSAMLTEAEMGLGWYLVL